MKKRQILWVFSLVSINKTNTTLLSLQLKTTWCLTQCFTKMWWSTSGHGPEVITLQKKKKLCQGFKSTCGVSCFFSSLFLSWEPGLDMTALPDCCCGQTVLCLERISPISNRSEEADQSAFPAWELYVSARHCFWGFRIGNLKMYKSSLES